MARSWREAATLMIATKSSNSKSLDLSFSRPDLLRLNGRHIDYQNFKMLLLKRSKSMGFMANAYVFPGGLVDKADFSNKWWDVFKRRSSTNDLKLLAEKMVIPSPSILQPSEYTRFDPDIENSIKDGRCLSPDLALRLTAIRETFEECGILIARPNSTPLGSPARSHKVDNTAEWQDRIQKDASEMIRLCLELDCSPDVWALYPWSNWLTPAQLKPRYNSIFYICTLMDNPEVNYSSEVSNHLWNTPLQYLKMAGLREIFLPPPQIYEMGRLLNFEESSAVEEFSKSRIGMPMQQIMPVPICTKDGFVHVLPGDQLYPKEPDIMGLKPLIELDSTIDELAASSTTFNRMNIHNTRDWTLECNAELDKGHQKPINLVGKIDLSKL